MFAGSTCGWGAFSPGREAGLYDKRKKDKTASEYEEPTKELYAQIGELTTKLVWLKKSGIDV